jgi:hypothetical protein
MNRQIDERARQYIAKEFPGTHYRVSLGKELFARMLVEFAESELPTYDTIDAETFWRDYWDPNGDSVTYEDVPLALARFAASRWIPVAERLPDNGNPVLVTTNSAYNHERRMIQIMIQSFEDGEWETEDVTHWQPLPLPFSE